MTQISKKEIKLPQELPSKRRVLTDDVFANYEKWLVNGHKSGYKIDIPAFDKIFSTYKQQFITITGVPGSGKSDFVDQMCIGYNKLHDWKIAYLSPENEPYELHLKKLMEKWFERPLTTADINSDKWNSFRERFDRDFTFLNCNNNRTIDQVLLEAKLLATEGKLDCLVIDPYNKVTLNKEERTGNINDDTAIYLNKVDAFCKENDVLVLLVAHPVKMGKTDAGDYLEPEFYNVKGGGEFFDMSYHGLSIHRPFGRSNPENRDVVVRVLKCKFRHLGVNGDSVTLKWDPNSGLYKDQGAINTDLTNANLPSDGLF